MSKLDWSHITGKVAVWCKTREETEAFLLAAEEAGKKWASGDIPTAGNKWRCYGEETCYILVGGNVLCYSPRRYYEREGYTIIPYADLPLPEKPRICEVLGVEVGERFKIDNPDVDALEFSIGEDGVLTADGIPSDFGIYIAINHPDRIIRQPRFTEDEVAAMRVLYAAGAMELKRDDYGSLWVVDEDGKRMTSIQLKLFPSILPGQSVETASVITK